MTLEIKRRASMVLASIVAVVFAMTALLAGAAQADEAAPLGPGNINPKAKGSITVHKLSNPGSTLKPTGDVQDPPKGAEPLKGVEFTVYKIDGLDVTKSADWTKISALGAPDANGDVAGYTKTKVDGPTQTNGNGVVAFTGLDLGVYVVVEGADNGGNNITAKAAPFLVTVPFPDTAWNYDVHVYPKNSVTGITKDVDDSQAVVAGQPVDWTVEATVPNMPADNELNKFIISDKFDARLKYESVVSVTGVGFTESLTDADYTVTHTNADNRDKVVIDFAGGIAKLKANGGKTVKVVFRTSVRPDADMTDGIIPNTAKVFVNENESDKGGVPSNTPETHWGKIIITKQDAANKAKLAGAVFGVYTEDPRVNPAATAVTTIETGADGVGSAVLKEGKYWVKETTAPAGYNLVDTVYPFEIHVKQNGDLDDTPIKVTFEQTIENAKSEVPKLPLTGASGQLLMMVGGGAVILLAAGTGLVAIKRRRA